jgi:hypothetical protein
VTPVISLVPIKLMITIQNSSQGLLREKTGRKKDSALKK